MGICCSHEKLQPEVTISEEITSTDIKSSSVPEVVKDQPMGRNKEVHVTEISRADEEVCEVDHPKRTEPRQSETPSFYSNAKHVLDHQRPSTSTTVSTLSSSKMEIPEAEGHDLVHGPGYPKLSLDHARASSKTWYSAENFNQGPSSLEDHNPHSSNPCFGRMWSEETKDSGFDSVAVDAFDSDFHYNDDAHYNAIVKSSSNVKFGSDYYFYRNFEPGTGSSSPYENMLSQMQGVLRAKYANRDAWFTPLPSVDQNLSFHLKDHYLEPVVARKDHREIEEPCGEQSIVSSLCENATLSGRRLLLEGDLGYGKSTLLKKIAYDWASGKSPELLQTFQLVFFVPLRELNEDLTTYLVNVFEGDFESSAAEKVIHQVGPKLLLLLDGYDELNDDEEARVSVEKAVLCRLPFSNVGLLLTSRPLRAGLKLQRNFSDVFVVRGFTEDSVRLFIGQYFDEGGSEDDRSRARQAELAICGPQSPVRHLATCPMLLYLLCHLVSQEDGQLPHTLTRCYQEIFRHGLIKGLGAQGPESHRGVTRVLESLGRVCIAALVGDRLYFSESELQEVREMLSQAVEEPSERAHDHNDILLHLGILGRTCTMRNRVSTYRYHVHHKSFLEYLVALYLTTLVDKTQLFNLQVDNIVHSLSEGIYSPAMTFLAGLLAQKAGLLFRALAQNNCVLNDDRLWDLLHEAGTSEENLQAANHFLIPSTFNLRSWCWEHGVLISAILSSSSCRVGHLHADLQTPESFRAMEDFPFSKNHSIHTMGIDARFSPRALRGSIFRRVLEKPGLTEFSAICHHNGEVLSILHHVSRAPSLRRFAFLLPSVRWGPRLREEEMATLEESLENSEVTSLYLYPLDCGPENLNSLARMLQRGVLEELHLPGARTLRSGGGSRERDPPGHFTVLFHALTAPSCRLRLLDLKQAGVSPAGCAILAEILTRTRTLQELNLGDSSAGCRPLLSVLQGAVSNPLMSHVDVSVLTAGPSVWLRDALETLSKAPSSLQRLNVSGWSFHLAQHAHSSPEAALGRCLRLGKGLVVRHLLARNVQVLPTPSRQDQDAVDTLSVDIKFSEEKEDEEEEQEEEGLMGLALLERLVSTATISIRTRMPVKEVAAMLSSSAGAIAKRPANDFSGRVRSTVESLELSGQKSRESLNHKDSDCSNYGPEEVLQELQEVFQHLEHLDLDFWDLKQVHEAIPGAASRLNNLKAVGVHCLESNEQLETVALVLAPMASRLQLLELDFEGRGGPSPLPSSGPWTNFLLSCTCLQEFGLALKVGAGGPGGASGAGLWLNAHLGLLCAALGDKPELQLRIGIGDKLAPEMPKDAFDDMARLLARDFKGRSFQLRVQQPWWLPQKSLPESFKHELYRSGKFKMETEVRLRKELCHVVTVTSSFDDSPLCE